VFGSWTADSTRAATRGMGSRSARQSTIVRLVRNALDGLLPEPFDDVLEREAEQRVRVAKLLDGLDE
jgi:hypothetical protein